MSNFNYGYEYQDLVAINIALKLLTERKEFKMLLDYKEVEKDRLDDIILEVENKKYKMQVKHNKTNENLEKRHFEENIDFSNYDIIYMIGGNTFYLLKELREKNLAEKIIQAINNGVIYIGSSAGSIILGKTIETALPYDENWVGLENFEGLNIVDGIIIPHANRKQTFIKEAKGKYSDRIIELYDDYGIVINN